MSSLKKVGRLCITTIVNNQMMPKVQKHLTTEPLTSCTPIHVVPSRNMSLKSAGSEPSKSQIIKAKEAVSKLFQQFAEEGVDEISFAKFGFHDDFFYLAALGYVIKCLENFPTLPKELCFKEMFSKAGYEVYLNVSGFNQADLQIFCDWDKSKREISVWGKKVSPLNGQFIRIDRTHVVSPMYFVDPEKASGCVKDGHLRISFAMLEKDDEAIKKVGKFPIKWVEA